MLRAASCPRAYARVRARVACVFRNLWRCRSELDDLCAKVALIAIGIWARNFVRLLFSVLALSACFAVASHPAGLFLFGIFYLGSLPILNICLFLLIALSLTVTGNASLGHALGGERRRNFEWLEVVSRVVVAAYVFVIGTVISWRKCRLGVIVALQVCSVRCRSHHWAVERDSLVAQVRVCSWLIVLLSSAIGILFCLCCFDRVNGNYVIDRLCA